MKWLFTAIAVLSMFDECSSVEVDPPTPEEKEVFLHDLALPEHRSCLMGFTPFPYDFSLSAVEETYDIAAKHSDMITFHLDNGVPWSEALAGVPFDPHVQEDLRYKSSQAKRFKKVYVSTTPQAHDRLSLAKYWWKDENLPLPDAWKEKSFDDHEVIAAYSNYCRYLIDFFEPDYFAYGIEVNGNFTLTHPDYAPFKTLVAEVYATLKKEYPDLPIFLTFQTGSFDVSWEEQQKVNRDLIQYSDLVGISTYPYLAPNTIESGEANVKDLPKDWFTQMAALAPEKPFAITETGFTAEDFSLKIANINLEGRELWQAEYVDLLLRSINQVNAEFVVWFIVRDYDQGWMTVKNAGLDADTWSIWRDTGLLDGNGRSRLGLQVWDRWLGLPRRGNRKEKTQGELGP